MVTAPISETIKAVKHYQFLEDHEWFINEFDLRRILNQHLPNRENDGVDVLDTFIFQLKTSLPPNATNFFRRFKVNEVDEQLKAILNTVKPA